MFRISFYVALFLYLISVSQAETSLARGQQDSLTQESASQAKNSTADGFPEKPEGVTQQRWGSLKTAVQVAQLFPSPNGLAGQSDRFGFSVSLSGNRALIGGRELGGTGAAIVFEDSGSGWTEVAVLQSADAAAFDFFGVSVSLSGNRALIGASLDDDNGSNSGSAHLFEFNGSVWVETTKLLASDGVSGDSFGSSVSLSGDRALISAPADDDNGNSSGSVYVFDLNGAVWTETTKLLPADGTSFDAFGSSVSLDGDRALIGASGDSDIAFGAGSAYVFDFDGVNWSESAKLITVVGMVEDGFGAAVSLSGDRALIGAPNNDSNGLDAGIAFVFDFDGAVWGETFKLLPVGGAAQARFGESISLDGDSAIIGAHRDNENGGSAGAAYIYDFDGLTWNETVKLLPADGANNDFFGKAVSMEGDRVLIGAYGDDDIGSGVGAAYVFDYNIATWSETTKLLPVEGAGFDNFGYSVSVQGDRALIGAVFDSENGTVAGAAYVFDYDGVAWNETTKLMAVDGGADDQFGSSVSLFGDRALIGAAFDDDNGIDSGSAYVFDFNGVTWSESAKLMPSVSSTGVQFGKSVSLSAERALIGAHLSVDNGLDSGAAYVFDFDGVSWSQTTRLLPADGATSDEFGDAVSLDGNRALVAAPRNTDNGSNSGSVYVFDFDGVSWSETVKLLPADGASGDYFGTSVSLSGDRALIGSQFDDDNGQNAGAAYVFDFDGVFWSETVKLLASEGGAFDRFGWSVSLSGDRALVGAYDDDNNGSNSGSANLFAFNGSTWIETAMLLPPNTSADDRFGWSVSVEGDRALVGAYRTDDRDTDSGSAFMYLSVNSSPVAFDDSFTSFEDQPMNANVFADNGNGSDLDPDGDSITVQSPGVIAASGIGGSVNLSANGDFTFTPPIDLFGVATFDYTIIDPSGEVDTASVTITVQPVNDQPGFAAHDPAALFEDDGPQLLSNWATFDAGAPNETDSVLSYAVTNVSNPALFSALPAVDAAGNLTFTPAANQFGTTTFLVTVQDDGGVANGGIDTSAVQGFTIKVFPVNDQPAFLATDPAAVHEDAGAQSVINWATFDSGAANEPDNVLGYTVANVSNPALFAVGPTVDTTGTLTFTSADDQFGTSSFDVTVQDNGGVSLGGIDTSDTQTFMITVDSVNDAPTFSHSGNATEIEDGDYTAPWASSISAGPANESGQSVTFMTTVTSNPGLFAAGPTIDPAGTLSFTPTANTTGSATIEAVAMDDGGTAMGGDDLSDPMMFSIEVISAADLSVDKTSDSAFTPPGGMISYTIVVTNPGPSDVVQARVTDTPPMRLGNVTWTCTPSPGTSCAPSGGIEIDELVSLAEGTSITFQLDAMLLDTLNDPITNTASVQTPVDVLELASGNNSDSDTDLVGMFADSMESIER